MSIDVISDTTGKKIAAELAVIAGHYRGELITNIADVFHIVQQGLARDVFEVGDQINIPWTATNGTQYTMPFDVAHFCEAELQDGEIVPGMVLQSHYATLDAIQFDAYEAFYYAADGLTAGTYNITTAQAWSKIPQGSFQFTLTQDVPAGGRLSGFETMPDSTTWKVKSWASPTATAPIETVNVSQGSGGTNLGTMSYNATPTGDVNNMQRVGYGYNLWSQSAYRQYLNSEAGIGAWWASKNKFDCPPSQLASVRGFLAGFDSEFINLLKPVKVITAHNNFDAAAFGSNFETTFDKFFLPSYEENFVNPYISGEGEVWEYNERLAAQHNKLNIGSTYPQIRRYAIENHTSPLPVRLRSCNRYNQYYAGYSNSSGNVTNYYSANSYRAVPACIIC